MGPAPRISRAVIIDMVAANASNIEIAAAVGCSGSTVTKLRKSLGLDPACKSVGDWTEARIEMLRKWWEIDGLTASQIAGKFGGVFSRNGIMGKVHRLNLTARPSPIQKRNDLVAVSRRLERSRSGPLHAAKIHAGIQAKALAVTAAATVQPAANAQRVQVPNGCSESSLTRVDSDAARPSPSVPHPAARNVPFAELHDRGCKFAVTGHQVAVRDARFCNAPRGQHGPYMPYCTEHYRLAVGNGTPSERRADEVPVSQRDLGSVDPWASAARRVG